MGLGLYEESLSLFGSEWISTPAINIQSGGNITLKPSGDTDDYFTFSVTSNVPLIAGTGNYLALGKTGTAGSATSSDDVYMGGVLEVDGILYADGGITAGAAFTTSYWIKLASDWTWFSIGSSQDAEFRWTPTDANANCFQLTVPTGTSTNVPVEVFGLRAVVNDVDIGLFDGITQPTRAVIEKTGKYATVSNATSVEASVTLTTATAGTFTNAVVGDTVRVTAGTNATAGWYVIDVVTDQYNINLDRNWCTGAVTGGTIVCYHSFTMLSADGIYTRTIDGTPSDTFVDLDKDGCILLDAIADNLWARSGGAWVYFSKTGGLSLTKEERIDPYGHEFQIGDKVELKVDRINPDSSFHASPVFAG